MIVSSLPTKMISHLFNHIQKHLMKSKMNNEASEGEESVSYGDFNDEKIIEDEISSWSSYERVFRQEDRIIFHQKLRTPFLRLRSKRSIVEAP